MTETTKQEIDFCVFLLYHLADAWKTTVPDVFEKLSQADIVNGYIIPAYDVLHTLGSQYLVDDITDLARERGVAV